LSVRPALVVLVFVALVSQSVEAGHEIPYYPSFYPQEIRIETVEPAAAPRLLAKNAIHAYLGPLAAPKGAAHLAWVESPRSFVLLTFNPASRGFGDARERCAAAARLAPALAAVKGEYVFHPYPVTPYHEDYLHHADLVEAAKARSAGGGPGPAVRLRVRGRLPVLPAGPAWRPAGGDWDATLEEVNLSTLVGEESTRLNGWLGPPWLKEGWFQAHALYARGVGEAGSRSAIEEAFARRTRGEYASAAERLGLERRLVSLLTRGCERVPVGYALRREAVNDDYSEGVENVGYDAQAGLGSAVFLRTVKLKDFPWNGVLRLGAASRPAAAWNPIAGFGDETGRLLWSALADAALLPAPQGGGWIPNRARAVAIEAGRIEVPRDALVPDPATGALGAPAPGALARQKITYRVVLSKFHDGTKMSVADLVAPYAFAYRWSTGDRQVERASALLRDWLAGVRVVKVEPEIKDFGDLQIILEVAVVDVYLRHAGEPAEAVAIAPPWSPIPWELAALMDEVVTRGPAAFSEDAARRRGVAWLDLARDRKLDETLAALAAGLERRAYVPEALRGLVSVAEARQRWAALRRFHRQHGHWLSTSGPYRLAKWTTGSAVLEVFRDLSYPNVVSSFDRYVLPRRAWVTRVERRGDRLELQADAESITKFARSYKIVREPLRLEPTGEAFRDTVAALWTVVGARDEVVATGRSEDVEGGSLIVDLGGKLAPGAYRVMLALALNGNLVNPEVKVVAYRVAE